MEKINNNDEKSILQIIKSIKNYVANINFIINKNPILKHYIRNTLFIAIDFNNIF